MESGPIPGGITRDEWLAALNEAAQPLPPEETDTMSAVELAKMFGVSRHTMNFRLERLMEMGKAERTTKRIRRTNGSVITVTAYRLIK